MLARVHGYQQFCPVAMAAEVVSRPWTPLVIRELLCGSVRFNDIHRGVARMSRSLLSQRLGELERAGVIERVEAGGHPEYHLTAAGEELRPIVMELGAWGKRWLQHTLTREHLDAGLLMWDLQRRLVTDRLPARRVVIRFHYPDAPKAYQQFWLMLSADAVDLCVTDPGHEVDLQLTTSVATMVDVWMGDLSFAEATRANRMQLTGPRELRRQFPTWLGLSALAAVPRVQ